MAELTETRVAVYIDFDNIIISEYDAVHGRGAFIKEKARGATGKTAEQIEHEMTAPVPSGRVSEADEIARTVAWLASSVAGHITGTNVTVDGGHTRGVT